MDKRCIACGMPMTSEEDFASSDPTKDYCSRCAKPDGTMKSLEEVLAGMSGFLVKTQGLDEEAAQSCAKEMMSELPAWKTD